MNAIRLLFPAVCVVVGGCEGEADPERLAFEAKFETEAVLVKTCPGDSKYATGPSAQRTRVYRYEDALWYEDVIGHRRVEATVEDVCDVLIIKE